jgi:hypothetical protein
MNNNVNYGRRQKNVVFITGRTQEKSYSRRPFLAFSVVCRTEQNEVVKQIKHK